MKKINYFDLGLYTGSEIEMFMNDVSDLNVEYEIFGFEADSELYKGVKDRFGKFDNIHIYNLAIADAPGQLKLYKDLSNKQFPGIGNSIFDTKYNVNKYDFEIVESILFTQWIKDNVFDFENSINILRFNIEGAELYLIDDIVKNGFVNNFELYLGTETGADIKKVHELKKYYDYYTDMLESNNIIIYPYCKGLQNIDLKQYLQNII